ncbi:Hypothetical predicted protein [Olea europaea subsp. europaea]|uniref:Uncharacterized protein n=1 Tax=Olea europaea subsp. europaea TaxID=158383 RepID=A0A8S0R8Q9_OLEEU|nr:Hypothetical predicted protein [Olea europaea subsp. europaea]
MDLRESSSRDGAPAAAAITTTDSDTAPTAIAPDSDTTDAVDHQSSLHTEDIPAQNPSGSNEISSSPSAFPADSVVPESTPANPSCEQRANIAWRVQPPAEVHKPSGSGLQQEKKRQASIYHYITS